MRTRQALTMKLEQFVALQMHQETNHQQHPFSFQSNENKMSASQTMLASNPRRVTDTHLMSPIVAANGNGSIVPPFGKFQFSKEHSGLKENDHTYFYHGTSHTFYTKQKNQFMLSWSCSIILCQPIQSWQFGIKT